MAANIPNNPLAGLDLKNQGGVITTLSDFSNPNFVTSEQRSANVDRPIVTNPYEREMGISFSGGAGNYNTGYAASIKDSGVYEVGGPLANYYIDPAALTREYERRNYRENASGPYVYGWTNLPTVGAVSDVSALLSPGIYEGGPYEQLTRQFGVRTPTLLAGQTFDILSQTFDDPNLHPDTLAVNRIKSANTRGIDLKGRGIETTGGRKAYTNTLDYVDEVYKYQIASRRATPTPRDELFPKVYTQAQITDIELNKAQMGYQFDSSNKTVLGTDGVTRKAGTATKSAIKRALA